MASSIPSRRLRSLANSISTNQHLFVLVVMITLLLGIGSWQSVRLAIESDLYSRLENETDYLESGLTSRLGNYVNTLADMRGYILVNGIPKPEKFQKIFDSVDFQHLHPGVDGIGFSPVQKNPELIARVGMVEPRTASNRQTLGFNMMSEPLLAEAIMRAIDSGEASLSGPLDLQRKNQDDKQTGFILYMPIYKTAAKPPTILERRAQIRGLLYIPLHAEDFFAALLGAPNFSQERVNFSVDAILGHDSDVAARAPVYERFHSKSQETRPLGLKRSLSLYGTQWNLNVRALPQFYRITDELLPTAIMLLALIISALIFALFKVIQNQLMYEKKSKAEIQASERKILEHTELLKKLNTIAQSMGAELDLDKLIKKFFRDTVQAISVSHAFLFFANREEDPETLNLYDCVRFSGNEIPQKSFNLRRIRELFGDQKMILATQPESQAALSLFLGDDFNFSDWILATIPSREVCCCGILMLARQDSKKFSEHECEMIENLISQVAIAIENARLFRQAQFASAAKSTFLANMSHEIRTPLGVILGFADMLSRGKLEPETQDDLVRSMRKNGEQLTRIIDDVLDLTKVEAGKLSFEKHLFKLSGVMHEIQSIMSVRSHDKGIEFHIEGEGRLPKLIETDEVRLKQILINVIGNAIKFTEEGSVTVKVHFEKNSGQGNHIVFDIEDTGIGISQEAQKELFQPFSQGDASNTRRFGGTGLGLALSRRLAEQLGGDIRLLTSHKNRGSVFEITLKCGETEPAEWLENLLELPILDKTDSEMALPPEIRLDGKKLLLVEDSEDNQDIFTYFLESAGAKVTLATNGFEAVKAAGEKDYDAVLMDIQIPGIDGKEAARRIRKQGYEKPIIALTAHAMLEEKQSCLQAGCNGQITKPVDGTSLLSQLNEFMGP